MYRRETQMERRTSRILQGRRTAFPMYAFSRFEFTLGDAFCVIIVVLMMAGVRRR